MQQESCRWFRLEASCFHELVRTIYWIFCRVNLKMLAKKEKGRFCWFLRYLRRLRNSAAAAATMTWSRRRLQREFRLAFRYFGGWGACLCHGDTEPTGVCVGGRLFVREVVLSVMVVLALVESNGFCCFGNYERSSSVAWKVWFGSFESSGDFVHSGNWWCPWDSMVASCFRGGCADILSCCWDQWLSSEIQRLVKISCKLTLCILDAERNHETAYKEQKEGLC